MRYDEFGGTAIGSNDGIFKMQLFVVTSCKK